MLRGAEKFATFSSALSQASVFSQASFMFPTKFVNIFLTIQERQPIIDMSTNY